MFAFICVLSFVKINFTFVKIVKINFTLQSNFANNWKCQHDGFELISEMSWNVKSEMSWNVDSIFIQNDLSIAKHGEDVAEKFTARLFWDR